MYREHFGLTSKPFDATADGAAVFMSPRQSEQIKTLHQGLGAQDAVVTVTGAVGVGKTTFVNKGLELIHPGRLVAAVGRMRMEPEDLFALLLSGFGISRRTKGMIRQIGAFRRYLHERAATGLQVAIVVEDAQRIGIEALVELEALTAADSGATSSANLVLMGQPTLDELLCKPDLVRLKQRVRQRLEIEALTEAETQGYLRHCLRHAGGEYDEIFDAGVAEIVFGCSEGVPRLINTLCEEVLNAATEDKLAKVTPALMAKIAESTFGYEADLRAAPLSAVTTPAELDQDSEEQSESDSSIAADAGAIQESPPGQQPAESSPAIEAVAPAPIPKPAIGHDIVVESGRYPEKAETSESIDVPESAIPVTDEPVADKPLAEEPFSAQTASRQATLEQPSLDQPSSEQTSSDPLSTDASMAEVAAADVRCESETAASVQHGAELAPAVVEPVASTPQPEYDPIPDLINDTQPELRQLAEPADHASTLTDIEPIIVLKDDDDDTGDTQTIETIDDPDEAVADTSDSQLELPTLSNSMRVEVAKEPDATMISADSPAATAVPATGDDAEPAQVSSVNNSDLPDQQDNEAALAAQIEAAYAFEQQDTPVAEVSQEATPQAAAESRLDSATMVDEEAAMAAELEMAYALEQQNAAAADSAAVVEQQPDAPQQADDEAAMAAELEMAYALEQQQSAEADNALAVDGDTEAVENGHTGIFENLDPLPDIDSLALEASDQPANENRTANKADSGDVTVTDLAVSAIREKPRQDIGALEDALQAAKQEPVETTRPAAVKSDLAISATAASGIPEITLDKSISDEQPKKTDVDKFAAEIGTANSLEEFSDAMAETLFGSEAFDQIAADVVANPPEEASGALEEMDKKSPVKLDDLDMPGAANESIANEITELSLEETSSQAIVDEKPAAQEEPVAAVTAPKPQPHRVPQLSDGGEVPLNESVAMRIDILNQMKNNVAKMAVENVELGESAPPKLAKDSGQPQPESIEDQIDTSITQTLKAVDIARMDAEAAAEEKAEKKSRGLFSRFRKSS